MLKILQKNQLFLKIISELENLNILSTLFILASYM